MTPTILVAEDDPDDRYLIRRAFEQARPGRVELRFVATGDELLGYLRRAGPFAAAPRPALVLLDLNLPGKDGWECLAELAADPALRPLRVVVLTTSRADVRAAYAAGAASYIVKPVTFAGLADVADTLARYWLDVVKQPGEPG